MFTPLVFLILAAVWAVVIIAFIVRRLYQLSREVQAEERALESMDIQRADYYQRPEPKVFESTHPS